MGRDPARPRPGPARRRLVAELGAMRIPAGHRLTMHYIAERESPTTARRGPASSSRCSRRRSRCASRVREG
ncbi:hypothetical protein FEF34_27750 [Streptomyces marianii]|uniref:Uncharacterized protein n=1 Tax=Streptomyces marianii TaxID=1817406 RepID=A0A5R9EEF5_9ACTN|nr:hypothetical protein FEF34_27750 [Streptomyces marianii]